MVAHLPELHGTSLAGAALVYPRDLPPMTTVMLFGFRHESRVDVQHWKRILDSAGIPWLSLPTLAAPLPEGALEGVAQAMRAHVPENFWSRTVQIHQGGVALLDAYEWHLDDHAKVLLVHPDGSVAWTHGGPCSEEAWEALRMALEG